MSTPESSSKTSAIDESASLEEQLSTARTELQKTQLLLDHSRREKQEFLDGIMHDLRSPLTSIIGFVETLQDENVAKVATSRDLDTIGRNANRMLKLVNALSDECRLESRQLTVKFLPIDPLAIIRAVSTDLSREAAKRETHWQLQVLDAIPRHIPTDPSRLRQILLTMSVFALNVAGKGGSVQAMVRFKDGEENGEIDFQLQTDGQGLTSQELLRLFDPVAPSLESNLTRSASVHRSLRIAQQLARLMGGDIRVETKSDTGIRVSVTIGTGAVAGVTRVEGNSDQPFKFPGTPTVQPLSGEVLLVEDSPDIVRLIRTHLKRMGLTVTEARNGRIAVDRALAKLRSEGTPYDLILMDLQMPQMDGLEATRTLREQGYDGPIVALTANAIDHHRDRALASGCDDFATKPVSAERLRDCCERWLEPPTAGMTIAA